MKKQRRQLTAEEELLKGYRRKLMVQAFFKSLIIGLISGFILSIPVSVISFITVYDTLWIALLIFGVATVGFTLLSYFKYYRTNLRDTAIRVDGAGLEERVITMIECADRDDAIAGRQREDAKQALKTVDAKKVKIPFPKTPFIVLAAAAVVGICMMVTSTVRVNIIADAQKEANNNSSITQPEESNEDRIIREMLEALRQTIDEAPVRDELKQTLHKMVDDLEASFKPEDTTDMKIARISETAQKIHKMIQDELSKTTIAQELQKHETTRQLGKAIESEDIEKIEKAFKDMYDSIAPLAYEKKYDRLYQTAMDILQSLEDADIKPDDALAKALEDLAEAFLKAIEIPPPGEGEEDRVNDEIDQAVQDAIQDALDAIKDAMQEQQKDEELDDSLQDIFQDAMEQLGQESSDTNGEEENPDEDEDKKDEDEENGDQSGSASPGDGDMLFWTVIDGETPYPEVYDEYYEWAMEMLTNGNLTDSERRMIENYLNMLKTEYGYGED